MDSLTNYKGIEIEDNKIPDEFINIAKIDVLYRFDELENEHFESDYKNLRIKKTSDNVYIYMGQDLIFELCSRFVTVRYYYKGAVIDRAVVKVL